MTAAALAAYKVTPKQGKELREKAKLPNDIRFLGLVEWDETIHRTIWTIANEPLPTSHLEKVVWTAIKVGPMEELVPEDQLRMVRYQLESERSGHPSGHGPLVEAICEQSPAAARKAMLVHFLTPAIETLSLSKEIMDILSAAFPSA